MNLHSIVIEEAACTSDLAHDSGGLLACVAVESFGHRSHGAGDIDLMIRSLPLIYQFPGQYSRGNILDAFALFGVHRSRVIHEHNDVEEGDLAKVHGKARRQPPLVGNLLNVAALHNFLGNEINVEWALWGYKSVQALLWVSV